MGLHRHPGRARRGRAGRGPDLGAQGARGPGRRERCQAAPAVPGRRLRGPGLPASGAGRPRAPAGVEAPGDSRAAGHPGAAASGDARRTQTLRASSAGTGRRGKARRDPRSAGREAAPGGAPQWHRGRVRHRRGTERRQGRGRGGRRPRQRRPRPVRDQDRDRLRAAARGPDLRPAQGQLPELHPGHRDPERPGGSRHLHPARRCLRGGRHRGPAGPRLAGPRRVPQRHPDLRQAPDLRRLGPGPHPRRA